VSVRLTVVVGVVAASLFIFMVAFGLVLSSVMFSVGLNWFPAESLILAVSIFLPSVWLLSVLIVYVVV